MAKEVAGSRGKALEASYMLVPDDLYVRARIESERPSPWVSFMKRTAVVERGVELSALAGLDDAPRTNGLSSFISSAMFGQLQPNFNRQESR